MALDGKLCVVGVDFGRPFSGEYCRVTASCNLTKHCMLYTSYCIYIAKSRAHQKGIWWKDVRGGQVGDVE